MEASDETSSEERGTHSMTYSPAILSMQFGGHDTAAALPMNGKTVGACEQEERVRKEEVL